jgi:hypothetical protein
MLLSLFPLVGLTHYSPTRDTAGTTAVTAKDGTSTSRILKEETDGEYWEDPSEFTLLDVYNTISEAANSQWYAEDIYGQVLNVTDGLAGAADYWSENQDGLIDLYQQSSNYWADYLTDQAEYTVQAASDTPLAAAANAALAAARAASELADVAYWNLQNLQEGNRDELVVNLEALTQKLGDAWGALSAAKQELGYISPDDYYYGEMAAIINEAEQSLNQAQYIKDEAAAALAEAVDLSRSIQQNAGSQEQKQKITEFVLGNVIHYFENVQNISGEKKLEADKNDVLAMVAENGVSDRSMAENVRELANTLSDEAVAKYYEAKNASEKAKSAYDRYETLTGTEKEESAKAEYETAKQAADQSLKEFNTAQATALKASSAASKAQYKSQSAKSSSVTSAASTTYLISNSYDPNTTDNPALAAKGRIFYINDQFVIANGDGTITTSAGNIFDAEGRLVGSVNGSSASKSSSSGSSSQAAITVGTATTTYSFDYDDSLFSSVCVDGIWIDPCDYSIARGTVITLNQDYFDALPEGVHTLTAYFIDGTSVARTFTISRFTPAVTNKVRVPNTADHGVFAYAMLMAFALGMIIMSQYYLIKYGR